MAYVANQNQEDDTAQNIATNLFQQNTGGQQQSQGFTGGQQTAPTAGEDQSAAISSGASGSMSNARAPQTSNSGSSSKEVVRRNQDKMKSPFDLGAVKKNITDAEQGLQDEANAYVTQQKTNTKGVDDSVIKSAVGQGTEADVTKVSQRLNQARPEYENFAQKTNTDFSSKVNELSDPSLRNYFKGIGGPQASAGDAAFDAMLLGKNNQFKKDRSETLMQAQGLDVRVKDIRDKTNTEGKSAYESAYGGETDRIKNSIRSQIDPVRQKAEAQAAAENSRRQGLRQMDPGSFIEQTPQYYEWLKQVGADVGQNSEEDNYLQDEIISNQLPQMNYIDFNSGTLSANNYLDDNQAGMINRGQGLLGSGGTAYSAAGGPSQAYSFNRGSAEAALQQIIGGRRNDLAKKAQEESVAQEKLESQKAQATIANAISGVDASGKLKIDPVAAAKSIEGQNPDPLQKPIGAAKAKVNDWAEKKTPTPAPGGKKVKW